jgi:Pyruvate:ferredoxin oxidoreductase and related 2-oxoacid:ferredoxin oxidoreductases, gamma subunit
MKFDIVLCGVGGQGGISVSVVIAKAAMAQGLAVKQSEVHGMAQRGGEVLAQLRLSDRPIASPLIPKGTASLLLAFEPLEALRHLSSLAPDAAVVAASAIFRNVPDCPPDEQLLAALGALPRCALVDAEAIARSAGNARAGNMALVGAASGLFPFPASSLERAIESTFATKGAEVVKANLAAFALGRELGRSLGSSPERSLEGGR